MKQLIRGETGANLVEWGLLAVLVAVFALVAIAYAGDSNSQLWDSIASTMSSAG